MTEMQLTIQLPTTLEEIPLGKFVHLLKGDLQGFLGIGDREIEYIPIETLNEVIRLVNSIEITSKGLLDNFVVGGRVFLLCYETNDWTLEELEIYNDLMARNTVEVLPELIALHTREARKRNKVRYQDVKEYGFKKMLKDFRLRKSKWYKKDFDFAEYQERVSFFKDKMSAELALDISKFYLDFGMEILRNLKISTDI